MHVVWTSSLKILFFFFFFTFSQFELSHLSGKLMMEASGYVVCYSSYSGMQILLKLYKFYEFTPKINIFCYILANANCHFRAF